MIQARLTSWHTWGFDGGTEYISRRVTKRQIRAIPVFLSSVKKNLRALACRCQRRLFVCRRIWPMGAEAKGRLKQTESSGACNEFHTSSCKSYIWTGTSKQI